MKMGVWDAGENNQIFASHRRLTVFWYGMLKEAWETVQ
jgi:hypothetical protein